MRSSTAVTIGVGATAAVLVAGLVQAAGEDPVIGKALSMSVPAKYKDLIEEAGKTCSAISPNLLAGLLKQESGFSPTVVSPVGAEGIAQFMPSTWASYGVDGNHDGVRDSFEPKDAIPAAADYLCDISEEVKNVPGNKRDNMLAAYNAGPVAVIRAGGIPDNGETPEYVDAINTFANTPTGGKETIPAGQAAAIAINAATDKIGTPYSWGGGNANGPSNGICCSPNGRSGASIKGFDCSGLTLYAYAKAGISLPRTAAQQYAASEPVNPGQKKPGDLVFYGSSSNIHHVAIYVGGGYMIEAPRPGTEVRFSPIDALPDLYAVARPASHTNKEI